MSEENDPLEKPPEAGIQQLNLSYDKVQDRLLFRVGLSDDTEVALWFTYRFARGLWIALNRQAHLPEAKTFANEKVGDAVEQFHQEVEATEALEEMDFETEYTPREAIRNDGVLLAVGFQLNGEAKLLEVNCLEDLTVNINLTSELILATCNMLQLAAKEAGWELTNVIPAFEMDESTVSKALH